MIFVSKPYALGSIKLDTCYGARHIYKIMMVCMAEQFAFSLSCFKEHPDF